MGNASEFLDHTDRIDPPWLGAVLARSVGGNIEISNVALEPIGAGNVSDTVRVTFDHNVGDGMPGSLVSKFSASEETAHAHGIASGSYAREVESYRAFGGERKVCRIPRLFWVEGGRDGINLVVEDLTHSARAGSQVEGCSPAEARSVVRELALLHRSYFPMLEREKPEWALTMAGEADYWSGAIAKALPIIRDNDRARITAKEWELLHEVGERCAQWYRLPVSSGTMTHGDPRVDNILFEDGKNGAPQAIIIDWQMTGWRNPMHDVGYFLSGSVTVDDRREHEEALLRDYHSAFGEDCGYALDAVRADYRVQLLSGLMTTVAAYAVLPMSGPVDLLLITLLKRNLAAAADWNSLEAF